MVEYDIENIRDTMNETGKVPDTAYFFYGGESEEFVNVFWSEPYQQRIWCFPALRLRQADHDT